MSEFEKRYPSVNLKVHSVDLLDDSFSLLLNFFSLVIHVHFYNETIFSKILASIQKGGFILFETVDARGGNFLELPKRGAVFEMLNGNFKIKECIQWDVEPMRREKLKILAQRR